MLLAPCLFLRTLYRCSQIATWSIVITLSVCAVIVDDTATAFFGPTGGGYLAVLVLLNFVFGYAMCIYVDVQLCCETY